MPVHISKPLRVPVPGDKTIDEYIGHANSGTAKLSVAHMVAPPGWGEPFQCPDFDEVTIVIQGKLRVETQDGFFDVAAGETILCEKGERIRYSNPFENDCELWAVCQPAFSPEQVNRDEA